MYFQVIFARASRQVPLHSSRRATCSRCGRGASPGFPGRPSSRKSTTAGLGAELSQRQDCAAGLRVPLPLHGGSSCQAAGRASATGSPVRAGDGFSTFPCPMGTAWATGAVADRTVPGHSLGTPSCHSVSQGLLCRECSCLWIPDGEKWIWMG